ncbi:MAG: hypothetical protein NTV33_11015 [Coprothermobacterota bacterium]|nr:hypothetical protein [Coprothermobacterota bacterium]
MIQDGRSAFKQQFPRFDPQADYYLTVSFSFNGKVVDVQGRNVLAAYASALVVPGYRLSQCLGFSANQMNEIADHFSELCGRLAEEMSSTDPSMKRAFLGVEENDLGIPPACGYYLGFILVQRLAEQYCVEELADWKIDCVYQEMQNALPLLKL